MSIDNGFAGLLGAWPPSGLLAAPQPDPTQTPGLLQAPVVQPTVGGVLGVPFDPASLTGPAFDPLQVIAGGPAGTLSPDDLDWPQALQALHARLLGGQPLALPIGDPGGYGAASPGSLTAEFSGATGQRGLDPNSASADFAPFGRVPGFHPSQPASPSAASTPASGPQTGDAGSPRPIGPNGWQPSSADRDLLTRMIFAETGGIPEDYPGIGWAIANRVGTHDFGTTLNDVLQQKNAFAFIKSGGGPAAGSSLWQASADPSNLTDGNAASWAAAQRVAAGIVNGSIPDPTGGATLFFSSSKYDPANSASAPGGFPNMLAEKRIAPSPYNSRSTGSNRNYLFVEKRH